MRGGCLSLCVLLRWGLGFLVGGLINVEMMMTILMIHGLYYYRLYFYSKPNLKQSVGPSFLCG
jgi:hypothetical protein